MDQSTVFNNIAHQATMTSLVLHNGVTSASEVMTSSPRNMSHINMAVLRARIYQHFMQIIRDKQYSSGTQAALIASFASLIMIGVLGNSLVCLALIRNKQMRTPRNLFIVNLAVSDLTICLLSQPLNLFQLLCFPLWNLGDVMCRLVPVFPATNVFVSTLSITAIALDRLQLTTCPTSDVAKRCGAAGTLGSIWLVSLLLASPMLLITGTQDISALGVVVYTACMEQPHMSNFRFAYSVVTLVCQYALPAAVVIAAYVLISCTIRARSAQQQQRRLTSLASLRLSVHSTSRATVTSDAVTYDAVSTEGGREGGEGRSVTMSRTERQCQRARRTIVLLLAIVAVFAISWLPLNAYNIMADINPTLISSLDPHRLLVVICHLFVLLSACVNPVLYGWLNDNFHREFISILRVCLPCISSTQAPSNGGYPSSTGYSPSSRHGNVGRLTNPNRLGVNDVSVVYNGGGTLDDNFISPPVMSPASGRSPLLVKFDDKPAIEH